jgi:hypothetical protein
MNTLTFGKPKKSKKQKYNNPHKVENQVADEIRRLANVDLITRTSQEYKNWMGAEKAKKNDGEVLRIKEDIQNLRKDIKSNPEYIKLEEEFKAKKEELVTEELARLEEELKNLIQPHVEDIKGFRGKFRVAMDEVTQRKDSGALK